MSGEKKHSWASQKWTPYFCVMHRILRTESDHRGYCCVSQNMIHLCHPKRNSSVSTKGDTSVSQNGHSFISQTETPLCQTKGDMPVSAMRQHSCISKKGHFSVRQNEALLYQSKRETSLSCKKMHFCISQKRFFLSNK